MECAALVDEKRESKCRGYDWSTESQMYQCTVFHVLQKEGIAPEKCPEIERILK